MATVITGRSGRDVYRDVLQHILKHGRERSPRGLATLDLGPTVVEVASPLNALPLDVGRNVSLGIGAVEAVQLIGGVSLPNLLLWIAPKFARYMNGDRFHGSYGARIGVQMCHVQRKLQMDADTRQAIVSIWDKNLDNLTGMHDYPCTVALQFELERYAIIDGQWNHRLNMNVFMRSNDAWLGLPYDMFQFTQLQMSLAKALSVPFGSYRHIALSMHIYQENVAEAKRIHHPTDDRWQPTGIGELGVDFAETMKRARRLASGQTPETMSRSEEWYRDRFASYHKQ